MSKFKVGQYVSKANGSTFTGTADMVRAITYVYEQGGRYFYKVGTSAAYSEDGLIAAPTTNRHKYAESKWTDYSSTGTPGFNFGEWRIAVEKSDAEIELEKLKDQIEALREQANKLEKSL